MITRRHILLGGVGLGLTGLGAWGLGHWALQKEIESVLHRRLSYLKLDDQGVRAFARDQAAVAFNKKMPTLTRLRYHFLSAGPPSFARFFRSADKRTRVERLEDTLVTTYLLSSDFFINGADESRLVTYIAYYDPMHACQNPFARPAVDPGAPA